ncbi:hypothetical protein [Allomesorhizobium camelthorni]|uniref:hypothetical protein n=1 Tax=Allomesorhizobium camelthorni TaxID=475069 RepID=UPI003CCCB0C4
MARMLAMEPEVLLFDESTSALDPELVGEVPGVMRGERGRDDAGDYSRNRICARRGHEDCFQ